MGEIADDHFSQMMWEYGNPYVMDHEPFADTPEFGGWRAYLLRHADDTPEQRELNKHIIEHNSNTRLDFSFKCKFCGHGITFINKKAFDTLGAHMCLKNSSKEIKS